MDAADLDVIASWLRDASFVVVLTGAGISTESGIPDFRGPQGVWTKNPDAEKTATLEYYMSDEDVRRRAWKNRVNSEMWSATPNAAHRALVELERKNALHALVTQNVDGLHHAAGGELSERAGHRVEVEPEKASGRGHFDSVRLPVGINQCGRSICL